MSDGNSATGRPVDGEADEPVEDGADGPVPDAEGSGGDAGEDRMHVGPDEFTPPPVPGSARSLLGRIGFGLTLVTVGALWLLRTAGAVQVRPGQIVAAGLLVVGLTLVVAAYAGRARGLIWLGLLLAPIVLAAELLRPVAFGPLPDWGLSEGAGDVTERPAAVDELEAGFRLGVGRFVVDLAELDLAATQPAGTGSADDDAGSATTSIELGVGELVIILPDNATVTVEGQVGIGELGIGPYRSGGIGLRHTETIVTGDGATELIIDARLGVGELRVVGPDDHTSEPSSSTQEVGR